MTNAAILHGLFGAAMVIGGLWVSVSALRRRAPGHDSLGLMMFLSGGVVAATGLMMLVTP